MNLKRPTIETLSWFPHTSPKVALYRKLGANIGERVHIGKGSFIWSPNFREVTIGDGVTIRDNTRFFCEKLTIQEESYVERDCFVSGSEFLLGFGSYFGQRMFVNCTDPVKIGQEVIISYTNIYTHEMNYTWVTEGRVKRKSGPVTIGRRASLAPGIHIGANVNIGEHSIIGSGSIVLKDISPYTLAAGVPCKEIRSIKDQFELKQDLLDDIKKYLEEYIAVRIDKSNIKFLFDESITSRNLTRNTNEHLILIGNSVDDEVFHKLGMSSEKSISAFDIRRQLYHKNKNILTHELKHRMRRFGLVFKPYKQSMR
jgi:acetyltransferase-like isoleucine patch superfamily enzyme